MKTQDKKEIREIFNEGTSQLVLPILDKILEQQEKMINTQGEHSSSLEDHSNSLEDHGLRLERMEQKLDVAMRRFDNHDIRISQLEKIHK